MLLKEEACEGARVRGPAAPRRMRDPTPHPAATYAVRLPQALLPPPPLVLADEPGGRALLRGAAQSAARSGREGAAGGCGRQNRHPLTQPGRGACMPHPTQVTHKPHTHRTATLRRTETQTQGTPARPPALAHSVGTTSTNRHVHLCAHTCETPTHTHAYHTHLCTHPRTYAPKHSRTHIHPRTPIQTPTLTPHPRPR